jgi:nucleoside phosphorylase
MNAKTLIAAVLSAGFAAGAFAQEATIFEIPTTSQLSRAAVQAQARQALRDGVSFGGEATVFADAAPTHPRSRAEVRAEAQQALRDGVSFGGEATVFPQDNVASVRTREEVRAETIEHLRRLRKGG